MTFCVCMLLAYIKLDHFRQALLKTSTGDKKRYVVIYETPNHFGSSMFKSLPVYQTITWYDSVSSFSGIEKKTTLTTLKNNLDDLMEILQFGDSPSLDLH